MQLVYLWVEKSGCLNNIGLNFSSSHRFEYEYKTRTLKYIKNEEYWGEFFRDDKNVIDNLTLIIGNNGSGKTSIIKYILERCTNTISEQNGIFVFWDGSYLRIYYNIASKKNIKNYIYLETPEDLLPYFKGITIKKNYNKRSPYENNKHKIEYCNGLSIYNYKKNNEYNYNLEKIQFIFYTNIFTYEYSNLKVLDNISNISTMGLMGIKSNDAAHNNLEAVDKNIINNFFYKDFYKQVDFVYNYNQSEEYIPFKLPKFSYVKFADLYKLEDDILKKLDQEYDGSKRRGYSDIQRGNSKKEIKKVLLNNILMFSELLNRRVARRVKDYLDLDVNVNDFRANLIKIIFLELLYTIMQKIDNDDKGYEILNYNIESILFAAGDEKKKLNDLFDKIIKFSKNVLNEIKINENDDIREEFCEYLNSMIKLKKCVTNNLIRNINYEGIGDRFVLEIEKREKQDDLKKFLEIYKKTIRQFNYLEFSWPLSSGENIFLNIFSRFYSLVDNGKLKNDKGEIEDIIILIDEGDISLHPEWQKKYIKYLISFFRNVFVNYRVQIMITTHSPILLSDIPSDNIIYLSKDVNEGTIVKKKNIKTFAANIYDIYKKGLFFNSSNFGIIGDFALDTLEKVEKKLSELENEINAIKDEVSKILDEYRDSGIKIIEGDNDFNSLYREKILFMKENAINKLEYCRKIINLIGEDFIRETLQIKYDKIYKELILNNSKLDKENNFEKIKENFNNLSSDEKRELIKYIINVNKNDGDIL